MKSVIFISYLLHPAIVLPSGASLEPGIAQPFKYLFNNSKKIINLGYRDYSALVFGMKQLISYIFWTFQEIINSNGYLESPSLPVL